MTNEEKLGCLSTLSNGIATAGRLRIFDPAGVILDPADAGSGTQISPTTVEIASTSTVDIDLRDAVANEDEVLLAELVVDSRIHAGEMLRSLRRNAERVDGQCLRVERDPVDDEAVVHEVALRVDAERSMFVQRT